MPIIVIGLSHHSSPVELRERFAFSDEQVPSALAALRQQGIADEAVILSTCNRVEIYAVTAAAPAAAKKKLKEFLLAVRAYTDPLKDEIYALGEPQSLQHLFKVACGIDSMVLGETEILGQLKGAYDLALRHGHTAGTLNRAFQRAFNVAEHIRTQTNIQRGSVSVASVAVELAGKIFSSLNKHDVLVIGAGDTGEKTARALLSRGARSVVVANRSHERAVELAAALGGRAVEFDHWIAEVDRVDIVVTSTGAPHYILNRAKIEPLMKRRRNRPLLLVDIAVPRNIDPEVNLLDNVYLYNIDDLQTIADDYLQRRKKELAECEAIIADKVKALLGAVTGEGPHAGDVVRGTWCVVRGN